jgi:hypothetical protein
MRTQIGWLACLLTAAMALTPGRGYGEEPRADDYPLSVLGLAEPPRVVRGQLGDAPPPDPESWLPLGKADTSGPYGAAEILFRRQTNPLHNQVIANRGVSDHDGSISGGFPGTFIGSDTPALRAQDVGPGTYALGFQVTAGWHFRDNIELEFNWIHMFDAKYSASAGPLPAGGFVGPLLADSFLTSPVFNFPPDFAGPAFKVNLGNPGATFGIWDASSEQSIEFLQRFDQYDLSLRLPLFGDECNRTFWTIGPRMSWIWERFKWRTVAFDVNTGQAGQDDVALYSNVLSQRLYGAHLGCGYDWTMGATPIGTWAFSAELEAGIFADVAKEIVKYERGDFAIQNKRSKRDYSAVPEVAGKIYLTWYITEAVEIRMGYNVMFFFNTIASPDPVSFNFGGLDPPFVKGTTRIFDGLDFGIGLKF